MAEGLNDVKKFHKVKVQFRPFQVICSLYFPKVLEPILP